MEDKEMWYAFLNKVCNIIVDDPPSDIPRKKTGKITGINNTHLILETEQRTIAVLLSTIRRIEVIGGEQ